MKKIITLLFVLMSVAARAEYFEADLVTPQDDPSLGTHLIIAGKSVEFGDLWLAMAHGQAMVFKGKKRHGKIRLISAIDNLSTFKSRLSAWGYTNVNHIKKDMTGNDIVQLIINTPQIASLDFVGHNAVSKGLAMENMEDLSFRFSKQSVWNLKKYKSNFMPDSYIRLTGCNTGWSLAPYMAEALGVPTSGTLTADGIQALYDTKNWFADTHHPSNAKMSTINAVSFKGTTECVGRAGCRRLKPSANAYGGKYGDYNSTLPFAKYFCGQINREDCARRAALAITTELSTVYIADSKPSFEQYAEAVSDLMCPPYGTVENTQKCQKIVTDHLSGKALVVPTYSPIKDPMASCTFQECPYELGPDAKGHTVVLTDISKTSTAFYDELEFYKLGFNLL